MRVSSHEFFAALEHHAKMRRAPKGSKSSGLKEAAFAPAQIGIWEYMAGGRHFVLSHGGQLESEIRFETNQTEALMFAYAVEGNGVAAIIEVFLATEEGLAGRGDVGMNPLEVAKKNLKRPIIPPRLSRDVPFHFATVSALMTAIFVQCFPANVANFWLFRLT